MAVISLGFQAERLTLPDRPLPVYNVMMEPTAAQTTDDLMRTADGSTAEHPSDRVRIVSTPGVCGGRPRIDGHRIQVEDVAIWHERMGMSPDAIVSEYPSITLAEVHAALAYYYENRQRIDADIEAAKRYAEEMKAKAGPSRLQEKLRQRKADAPDDRLPRG
jgi:uncharacterized protein (DUF433 family)